MSKDLEKDFEKNPIEMLETSLRYYTQNEKMSEELKEKIRNNLNFLSSIPEGIILEVIDPFLEIDIFNHDLTDLVECGLYNFIYSNALSLIAGSRDSGGAE